jgi:hypothetical protein
MADWPAIVAPSLPTEEYPDPAIRSKAEGGYVLTRPRYTRMPRSWNLAWEAMTNAHYLLLMAFWTAKYGGSTSFTWICVTDDTETTVRFSDKINAKVVAWASTGLPKLWSVSVKLEEV